MYGIFSNPNSGRSIKFHRLLAFMGIAGSVIFGVFFIVIAPDSNELIWDRVVVTLFTITVYLISFRKKVDQRKYARLVYFSFYIYSAQVVWAMLSNDFQLFYILSFFVTIQACGFSFRHEHDTFWYFLFMIIISVIGLYGSADIIITERLMHCGLISAACVMSFLAARQKCRFMHDMKMSENLMKGMVSKTEEAILLTDVYGNILDMNERTLELFGYSRNELVDCDFKLLRKIELSPENVSQGLNSLNEERFWNTQSILVKKSMDEFHARISITFLSWGRKNFMVYRVLDISDIKKFEAQILEQKEKAEGAALAKTQFLAVMSHEIRTPLNGVIATASLLQKADLTFEQMEYADTIKRSGDSLLMLINDILEFSKMESGKMQLDAHNSSVSDVMFDVMDLLRPHAESKGLKLSMEIENDVPTKLWMDGHRLKQILLNLTGNAIKFTHSGNVKVVCQNMGIIKREVVLRFLVQDTGIGIPEDKMHKLFKTFSQVDSSTSRKYGGTGLGLAISKQLVEMMQGEIHVTSRAESGTEFSFTLKCELFKEGDTSSEGIDNISVDYSIVNMQVMVAEDNDINKQVFHFMLDSLKVATDFADNGLEVVKANEVKNYDLIFMDMQMPEMDGLEATRAIRLRAGHQPIIVAISANAYADDRRLCAEAGMNDFLPKPFDMDQLKAILTKWSAPTMHKMDNAA